MKYYIKTIIPIIEANYSNFTPIEKSIADFFITNRKKLDFSAKSISELLFTSEASLSRFAKKCGYRGYREFIFQYEEGFVEKAGPLTGHTRGVLNTYQELLNKAYNLVDEIQIARIGRYLSSSFHVLACGMGSSGLAAKEMELRFMRIGVEIKAITDSEMIKMHAVFQKESSLVIGISISGEKEEILFLLRESHKRKARTVLITASNKGIFHEFCDEVVLLPSLAHLNYGNVISAQFPISVMIDICYSYYLEQNKYEKELLHEHTLEALQGNRKEKFL